MSSGYYGKKLPYGIDREERENIDAFLEGGEPVILVNDLNDLEQMDIDPNDVKMMD